MAAVIIAPLTVPARPTEAPRRPHLRPVPDLPAARSSVGARPSRATFRRRRLVVGLLALVCCIAAAVALITVVGTVTGSASDGPGPAAASVGGASSYVVQPGDTVWAIARRIQPDGDVRDLVDQITERAGGADLRPGQTIDLDGLG